MSSLINQLSLIQRAEKHFPLATIEPSEQNNRILNMRLKWMEANRYLEQVLTNSILKIEENS